MLVPNFQESLTPKSSFSLHGLGQSVLVYYESIKREAKIRPTCECRCDERLKTKTEESTLLGYRDTGFLEELEHLQIKTRLIDEMFASVMGEYVFLRLDGQLIPISKVEIALCAVMGTSSKIEVIGAPGLTRSVLGAGNESILAKRTTPFKCTSVLALPPQSGKGKVAS